MKKPFSYTDKKQINSVNDLKSKDITSKNLKYNTNSNSDQDYFNFPLFSGVVGYCRNSRRHLWDQLGLVETPKIFGTDITKLNEMGVCSKNGIPYFLLEIATELLKRTDEGCFRVPGNLSSNKLLKSTIDENLGSKYDYSQIPTFVLADVFRSFYNQLPSPILPEEVYQSLINTTNTTNFSSIFTTIPHPNKSIFEFTLSFLSEFSSFQSQHKMNIMNLSLIFSPSLLRSDNEDIMVFARDSKKRANILTNLIKQANHWTSTPMYKNNMRDKTIMIKTKKPNQFFIYLLLFVLFVISILLIWRKKFMFSKIIDNILIIFTKK